MLLDEFLKPSEAPREEKEEPTRGSRKVLAPGLVTAESEAKSPRAVRDLDQVARLFTEDKTTVMMRNIPNRYTCRAAMSFERASIEGLIRS